MDARRTFLVIEPFGIIAEDLALSIADLDGGAEVLLAKSADMALPMIEPLSDVTLAIVNTDPAAFAGSPLATALAAQNAAVILIGDEAEFVGERAGYPVMHRPYAPDTVIAMLSRVLNRKGQAGEVQSPA